MMRCKSRMHSLMDKPMPKIEDTGSSTTWGAIANFVNSIIGAGIMTLPYSLKMTGFVAGIIMYILAAVMAYLGYIFAIKSGIRKNILNFEPLSKAVFGRWSMYNFFFTYYVNAVGICTAYIILIGDSLTRLFAPMGPDFPLANIRITMIITTCIILCKTCICLYCACFHILYL